VTAVTPIGTARALTDLDGEGFRVVAVRGRVNVKDDGWAYTLPGQEIAALKAAIGDGTLIAVTARADDKLRLLAKLARGVRQ